MSPTTFFPSRRPRQPEEGAERVSHRVARAANQYERPPAAYSRVMVFDGRVSHTNASESGAEDILALTDLLVHVLPDGYGFNLQTKRPLLPSGEEVPKTSLAPH